jgi:uncharacterized protein
MSLLATTKPISSAIRVFPLRLSPNADVLVSIRTLMIEANLRSVFIMTCVGSIKSCRIRMANTSDTIDVHMPHEIVSLVGTFDSDGEHVHGSFSDITGHVLGGHIMNNHPMTVFTTVELVLGECSDVIFKRELDHETGYPELTIAHARTD